MTPLEMAIRQNHSEIIHYLQDHSQLTPDSLPPTFTVQLQVAIVYFRTEFVILLLDSYIHTQYKLLLTNQHTKISVAAFGIILCTLTLTVADGHLLSQQKLGDPPPTWEAVVTALRSPIVNKNNIAAQLESLSTMHQYASCQFYIPAPESLATSAATHSSRTTPPPSDGSQKPPFDCWCGRCTSFRERDCRTPIPSTSSFPYFSGLTHEQQQELRGRFQF